MASYSDKVIGAREDLSDIITNISPTETPLMTKFGKTNATGVTHSWLTDSLRAPAANKHSEDADFVMSAASPRVKLSNNIQIFMEGAFVTETEQAISKAGVKDELAYQMQKAMRTIARDVEYAIINNTAAALMAGATVGQMGGIQAFNTVNVLDNSATPRDLTEDLFNDAMQAAWVDGGSPDIAVMSGTNKRILSSFTAGAMKTHDSGSETLKGVVNVNIGVAI